MSDDNKFVFRFPNGASKQEFKVVAASLNKSMTELLGEIILSFLETKREPN